MGRKTLVAFLVLAFFCAGLHWQLVFARHAPLWDAAEYYLPCRLFLSDCIRHGIVPLWNPYSLHGIPFAADPQSGFFYPVAWGIGLLRRYDLYSYGLEHGLTLYAAATGAFLLMRRFKKGTVAALVAACCYAGCGAFTSNAEHLTWLIAAAWLPWVVWSYLNLLATARPLWALATAFLLYLLLTGGYPGFLIVAGYVLLGCAGVAFFRKRQPFRRLAGVHLLLGTVFLLLALFPVLAWTEAAPYITRGQGVTLQKANGSPFSLPSFLSFLLPFPTLKDDARFGTDVSMRNAYFGLSSLLVLAAVWRPLWQQRHTKLLVGLALLFLACAVGPVLPLRALLYYTLPGMNLFRFPALFRFFTLLALVLLVGSAFVMLLRGWSQYRKGLLRAAVIAVVLFAAVLGRSLARHGLLLTAFFGPAPFSELLTGASFNACLQLQALVQTVLALLVLGVSRWAPSPSAARSLLVLLLATDLAVAAQLNVFGTVTYTPPAEPINERLHAHPRDFAPPSLKAPLADASESHFPEQWPLHRNVGVYLHRVVPDGYNPFMLRATSDLEDRVALHDSVWANPLAYVASGYASFGGDTLLPGRRNLLVDASTARRLQQDGVRGVSDAGTLVLQAFRPGYARLAVRSVATGIVVLQQSLYPGWEATLDGRPVPLFASNIANLSVAVPPGRHLLEFRFRWPWLLWIPVGWGVFLVLALWIGLRERRRAIAMPVQR